MALYKDGSNMVVIEGHFNVVGMWFVLVVGWFNFFIMEKLFEGVFDTIRCLGGDVDAVACIWVLGVFEIPLVVQVAVEMGQYDVVVVLGTVICGVTFYFDYVVGEVSKGVVQVSLSSGFFVVFGVLIIDTIE